MSFVTTQPEALAAAAGSLQGIGSALSAQNAAAAAPTTGVVPAAADEVSALTAAQFAAHAQMYQAVSAQAAAIHEQFVNTLGDQLRLLTPRPRSPTRPPPADRRFSGYGRHAGLGRAGTRQRPSPMSTPSTQTPRFGSDVRLT